MKKLILLSVILIVGCEEPKDCAGLASGVASEDECGMCTGGTTGKVANYLKDCADECGGTSVEDECGVCDGDGSDDVGCGCFEAGPSGCDETCGSTLENDACGVCGGDGSTCIVCADCSDSECCDCDGNMYETVQIGEQLWMAENLKTTHYNDGSEITHTTNSGDWGSLDEGQYGVYDNADIWGNLYNWAVVDDDRGVCPDGWHVPSDGEFMELEMYLGMSEEDANSTGYRGTNEGSQLAGNSDLWFTHEGNPNTAIESDSEFGTSGFNGLPAGYRDPNGSYGDLVIGYTGYFWSSSEYADNYAWTRKLWANPKVIRQSLTKQYGVSIRCLRD